MAITETFDQILHKIITAIHGRDMRQAIHDGMLKCKEFADDAVTKANAVNSLAADAKTAAEGAETAATDAKTAASEAVDAVDNCVTYDFEGTDAPGEYLMGYGPGIDGVHVTTIQVRHIEGSGDVGWIQQTSAPTNWADVVNLRYLQNNYSDNDALRDTYVDFEYLRNNYSSNVVTLIHTNTIPFMDAKTGQRYTPSEVINMVVQEKKSVEVYSGSYICRAEAFTASSVTFMARDMATDGGYMTVHILAVTTNSISEADRVIPGAF